jgi:drug/metabolite transporter (DMT)-like permease
VLALSVSVPETPTIPALDWAWLVLFAFIWLLGGTLLTTYGVTHLQASRASILQVVELLVAVLSAVWLGGEHIGIKEGIGGAMIIAATLIEANNH